MEHTPVMLRECIDELNVKPGGTYIDGTLGRGGHMREIAKRLSTGRIIAIDRDADAIKETSELLAGQDKMISYVHGNFSDIPRTLDDMGIDAVDGMLFDLGVSSPQIDYAERGFSYMTDSPLDMRMDRKEGLTAFEIVNYWPEDMLRNIFYKFGEERYAGLIARAIARKRVTAPIMSTLELSKIIISIMPAAARREAQHPAKRCFQAIRLATNNELEFIGDMLDSAPDRLKAGGRICIVSYQSLEDRLVKVSFAKRAGGCVCPKDFPVCICGIRPTLRLVTKKPITPDIAEVERNPRARSAKLRVAERI